MEKILTVSCIGLGNRGYHYLELMQLHPDKYKIVSLCEKDKLRLEIAQKDFKISDENCFLNEEDFFKEKRSDILVIATQDQDHVGHAIKALKLGYDLLLEKPISNKESEVRKLYEAYKKNPHKIFICHVLRYSPAFNKVHDMIKEGKIGRLVAIDSLEQVYYAHQAHSFVRGNWRNKELSSPMCLQKTCHDYDLLSWLADSKADFVTSVGDLTYFKKENKPEGAASRCMQCKFKDTCVYSAYKIYITDNFWGKYMVTDTRPLKDEDVIKDLEKGRYGRCVFECDNNVVDNQFTTIVFKNGVKATLLMTAFTGTIGRIYKFYGTLGEIDIDEENGYIKYKPFGKTYETIEISTLCSAADGHGGGDNGIINNLYNNILGEASLASTSIEESIESHLIAFASEKSRMRNGKKVKL